MTNSLSSLFENHDAPPEASTPLDDAPMPNRGSTATAQPPTSDTRDFEQALAAEPVTLPRVGDIVEGTIIARKTAAVFIDLGARGTGLIFGREFFSAQEVLKKYDIGQTIHAKVIEAENPDGYVELSVSEAGRELAWKALKKAYDEKETIDVTIEAANRGGLMATLGGVKAFLPVSQLTPEHYPHVDGGDKEKILSALRDFIGKTLRVKLITFEPHLEKFILSEREVLDEELREALKNFRVGDTVEGVISGIVDFGLFVRFGPNEKLEGLAHISELDWGIVENIHERFKVGERITAKILELRGEKVSLSLKALLPNPWEKLEERLHVGDVVSGKILKRLATGFLAAIEPGVQGIVRSAPTDLPSETTYSFRIVSLAPQDQRMELELVTEAKTTENEESVSSPEIGTETTDADTSITPEPDAPVTPEPVE